MANPEHLQLSRCPHCSIDNPNLSKVKEDFSTINDQGGDPKSWGVYYCRRCGGAVLSCIQTNSANQWRTTFPEVKEVDKNLPPKVKVYLKQAIDCMHAPAGAVMLCASAVDAMLKEKGYTEGSLYKRINDAVTANILKKEMAVWAHQVRLDANDQRHADEEASMPTVEDAKQAIEFTKTLAEFLFVLPAKVTRGIETSKHDTTPK